MDDGELTAVELTQSYLDRIDDLNDELGAVLTVNPDALDEAAASDEARGQDGTRGPLEGIPVLVKDNVDTQDMPTTAGSRALLGSEPDDATITRRLREAGAVIIGKANLSEWANFRGAASTSGWSGVGGQTANPYVLDRNPCGSSSGSGTGVAAALAQVAIGTETDGSIVCPAGATDTVGVKPTLGLVSRTGVIPISAQQDTAGPITRTVIDAAAVLSAIQGVDPADAATAGAGRYARRDYLRTLDPGALRGKRIGVWRGGGAEQEDVAPVLTAAIATLRARGATVVDDVDLPGLAEAFENEFPALLVEFKHDINAYLAARPGPHPGTLAGLIEFNRANAETELRWFGQDIFEAAQQTSGDLTDPAYVAARTAATGSARRAIDSAIAAHDLDAILAPTNGPAWVTDLENGDDFSDFVSSSGPAAVAGYPNVTVPAGHADGVLPLGMSFFGGRWSEPALLSVAYAFEQATLARQVPRYLPTLPSATAPAPTGRRVPVG
jgi:amidase